VAIKLSPYFTALPNLVFRLETVDVKGFVLFNRFYHPELDLDQLQASPRLQLSDPSELRLRLQWLAILSSQSRIVVRRQWWRPWCRIGAEGHCLRRISGASGVGPDQKGPEHLALMIAEMQQWLEEHEYHSLGQLRGSMNLSGCPDPEAYQRGNLHADAPDVARQRRVRIDPISRSESRKPMIDISVLYGGIETTSTPHRYGRKITQIDPPQHQRMAVAKSARERRPSSSGTSPARAISSASTATRIRRHAAIRTSSRPDNARTFSTTWRVQSPGRALLRRRTLVRRDLFDLAAHARSRGLHVVLSTNGTLIDRETAQRFKELEFATSASAWTAPYPPFTMNFRGVAGAFQRTMKGFRHCVDVSQKVGLRLTLTRHTCQDLDRLFKFIEDEGIDRACFYHLCPAAEGAIYWRSHPRNRARPSTPSSSAPATSSSAASASRFLPWTTIATVPTSI
jgi:hypothetical protein